MTQTDVKWAKLGRSWWPAQVTEDYPRDLTASLKKSPHAIVKFFNEDCYEVITNTSNILDYRGEKRVELIKKGLTNMKSQSSDREKFIKDVKEAEVLSGGNPSDVDEIEKELKAPQTPKKPSYMEIFKPKEPPVSTPAVGIKFNFKKMPKSQSSQKKETHFTPTPQQHGPRMKYSCDVCRFSSDRVGVMNSHRRGHSSADYNSVDGPDAKSTSPSGTSQTGTATPVKTRAEPPKSPSKEKTVPAKRRGRKKKEQAKEDILNDWSDEEFESAEKQKDEVDESTGPLMKKPRTEKELSDAFELLLQSTQPPVIPPEIKEDVVKDEVSENTGDGDDVHDSSEDTSMSISSVPNNPDSLEVINSYDHSTEETDKTNLLSVVDCIIKADVDNVVDSVKKEETLSSEKLQVEENLSSQKETKPPLLDEKSLSPENNQTEINEQPPSPEDKTISIVEKPSSQEIKSVLVEKVEPQESKMPTRETRRSSQGSRLSTVKEKATQKNKIPSLVEKQPEIKMPSLKKEPVNSGKTSTAPRIEKQQEKKKASIIESHVHQEEKACLITDNNETHMQTDLDVPKDGTESKSLSETGSNGVQTKPEKVMPGDDLASRTKNALSEDLEVSSAVEHDIIKIETHKYAAKQANNDKKYQPSKSSITDDTSTPSFAQIKKSSSPTAQLIELPVAVKSTPIASQQSPIQVPMQVSATTLEKFDVTNSPSKKSVSQPSKGLPVAVKSAPVLSEPPLKVSTQVLETKESGFTQTNSHAGITSKALPIAVKSSPVIIETSSQKSEIGKRQAKVPDVVATKKEKKSAAPSIGRLDKNKGGKKPLQTYRGKKVSEVHPTNKSSSIVDKGASKDGIINNKSQEKPTAAVKPTVSTDDDSIIRQALQGTLKSSPEMQPNAKPADSEMGAQRETGSTEEVNKIAEQVVHLVPVENPDGTVTYMLLSLGNQGELCIDATEGPPPTVGEDAIYIEKETDGDTFFATITQPNPPNLTAQSTASQKTSHPNKQTNVGGQTLSPSTNQVVLQNQLQGMQILQTNQQQNEVIQISHPVEGASLIEVAAENRDTTQNITSTPATMLDLASLGLTTTVATGVTQIPTGSEQINQIVFLAEDGSILNPGSVNWADYHRFALAPAK